MLESEVALVNIFSNCRRLLVRGPHDSGKTSLLFSLAYEIVHGNDDAYPLYICKKECIENKFPKLIRFDVDGSLVPVEGAGAAWDSAVLGRIGMKYITASSDLRTILASIQFYAPLPSAIFIDDIDLFFEAPHESNFYSSKEGITNEDVNLTSGFLEDAVDYLDEILPAPCILCISSTSSVLRLNAPFQKICRQFFSLGGPAEDMLHRPDVGAVSHRFVLPSSSRRHEDDIEVAQESTGRRLYHKSGEPYACKSIG